MKSGLTAADIEQSVTTKTLGRAVEIYPIALTTESLALGWLRQRHAPHGAMVVADQEIFPRTRTGDALTGENTLSFSLVVRPVIAVDYQDILWAAALTSACSAYERLGVNARPWWPESLVTDDAVIGHVRAETQLAPGTVESSVLTYRLGFESELAVEAQLRALDQALNSLEETFELLPTEIAARYVEICALEGRPIRMDLRPNGASGGTAESIDERGGFGVAASSGSVTRYGVDQIREIRLRG